MRLEVAQILNWALFSSASMWSSERSSCSHSYPFVGSQQSVLAPALQSRAILKLYQPVPFLPAQLPLTDSFQGTISWWLYNYPLLPEWACQSGSHTNASRKRCSPELRPWDSLTEQSNSQDTTKAHSCLCDLTPTVPTLIPEGTRSHLILSTRKLKGSFIFCFTVPA